MPRVTSIEFQQKNKDRINLYVDGKYLISMYAEMVYKYNISLDSEIDREKLTEIIKADDYEKAKNKALNYISRLERSEKKVREKLEGEFDQEIIERVIEFLKKYSFIDDRRYANRLATNAIKYKRVGRNRIKRDLYIKGLDTPMIEKTISEINGDEELENAIYLAEKKLSKIKSDNMMLIRTKLYQHLSYKGFSYDTINSAINHLLGSY
nr:recombination regulator RecX [uncultured Peptostreptococcus sp.]